MKIKLSDWKHMTYEQLENKYNISREQIYKIILDQKFSWGSESDTKFIRPTTTISIAG